MERARGERWEAHLFLCASCFSPAVMAGQGEGRGARFRAQAQSSTQLQAPLSLSALSAGGFSRDEKEQGPRGAEEGGGVAQDQAWPSRLSVTWVGEALDRADPSWCRPRPS